jgi:hypothetical protein
MKKSLLLTFASTLLACGLTVAQAPSMFNYQAVARDATGGVIADQNVSVQISILSGSATGTSVYTETHSVTTSSYGLFNFKIGDGTVVSGDIATIDWSANSYFVMVEFDPAGGSSYTELSTSQLSSVPYSLFANDVLNDAVDDADADPANEIQSLALNGNTLEISSGNNVDLSPYAIDSDSTNEIQTLSFSSNTLSLSGSSNTVDLSVLIDDQDADTTNEIQSLSISGSDLTISGGNTITLPSGGITGSGTTNYLPKFTAATAVGNSMMRDDGTGTGINVAPADDYMLYVYKQQLTADGDGQATVYGYRTRNSQNDGVSYSQTGTNNAIKGYNYWGDVYTFGVAGFSYNDYTRTGGVLGAQQGGSYWGSLGYKNSSSSTFGVYGSSGYGSGTGFLPTSEAIGVGGGFFGELIGSMSKGDVVGQFNSGELFAQYNRGNVYTLGKNIELVKINETVTPVYTATSVEATIYAKGTITLTNGSAYVSFSDDYKSMLGETPVVTATPNGACNGVYVSSVDKNGFTITEQMNGSSNATISWISVGNRVDNDKMELATEIVADPSFDRNIQQVLFSDGNVEGSASGVWWNGSTLKFGEIPAQLTAVGNKTKD